MVRPFWMLQALILLNLTKGGQFFRTGSSSVVSVTPAGTAVVSIDRSHGQISNHPHLTTNKRTIMDGNATLHASKRLATIVAMLTLTFGLSTTQSQAAGVWTNEPSGASVVLDCPFNSVSGCGILDVYSSSQITSDSTAPVSKSSVVKSAMPPLNAFGGSQMNYTLSKPYREMYVGIIWRTNPEFQGRNVCNKMFFMKGPDSHGTFCFGNGAPQNGSNPLIWFHNTGNIDNSHTCALDLGLVCWPNVSAGTLTVGTWYKIEAYIKASTTNTSRDGIIRWWVNGVLAGNYTNFNYASAGLNEWIWTETWDGCGLYGALPCDLSHTNTAEWAHYIDHLHISIPNGAAGVDTPPGPPMAPTIRSVTAP